MDSCTVAADTQPTPDPSPARAARVAERDRPSILVVVPTRGLTFVEEDIRILSENHAVEVVSRADFPSLRELLPRLIRRLATARHALVYVWFAEPYDSPYIVLLSRLFGAKCAIVVGGYDVASVPSLGYGSLTKAADRLKVRIALRAADVLLPTSRLLEREARALARRTRLRVIYPGVDCAYFTPSAAPKERLVVTVGTIAEPTWRVKGLDVFARCSALLPDVQFAILGPCTDATVLAQLEELGGQNLTVIGRRLSREELLPWFQRAAVYAQLSVRESFGLAVAEAMSCGCVPVAANVGSLPEVVASAGFLVEYGNAVAAADAIADALKGKRASLGRDRVKREFPVERRERELNDAIAGLLATS